jgi:soluble lytic murein transglycosylase-like protein
MDLSTNTARLALATKYAPKYGLDPCVVAAVCEQESAWNPFAVRWEPSFFQRYIVPQGLQDATEAYTRAMSFGLMQIMGETAREFGFEGKFLTALCDPDVGVEFGCRKLQKEFEIHRDTETALLAYNGGDNPEYGLQVIARVPHYMLEGRETQGAV